MKYNARFTAKAPRDFYGNDNGRVTDRQERNRRDIESRFDNIFDENGLMPRSGANLSDLALANETFSADSFDGSYVTIRTSDTGKNRVHNVTIGSDDITTYDLLLNDIIDTYNVAQHEVRLQKSRA